jgi:CHAT domain-containing protein
MDAHEVCYSPSASLYCSTPPNQDFDQPLFIAFSGKDGLTSIAEVEEVSQSFPGASVLINPSLTEIRAAFESPRRLIHICGHAGLDMVRGEFSWIDTDDGRLSGRDLTDMRMRARTLVITGCQTARRIIHPGDEWLGLMRALYISGASSIVAAFWDIRDETARRFSTEFYRHFDGSNAASAVQKASVEVRHWQTHPYFWSGFGAFERKNR